MSYRLLLVLARGEEGAGSVILHHELMMEAEDHGEVNARFYEAADAIRRLMDPPLPSPKFCAAMGPGENPCQLEPDHAVSIHQHQVTGEKGVLGTLYWEFDPEDGLIASWKPERGALESDKEWKARQARYRKNKVV